MRACWCTDLRGSVRIPRYVGCDLTILIPRGKMVAVLSKLTFEGTSELILSQVNYEKFVSRAQGAGVKLSSLCSSRQV